MRKSEKEIKKDRAITLIALVVTMIILLILAGVTVGLATNQTGLFEKAKLATDEYNNKAKQEETELTKMANEIDNNYIEGNREIADTNPAGTIIAYMGLNAPSGYLPCDGTVYNKADYENLFNVLKDLDHTGWTAADWNTEFTVPDLRGEFLRGTGNNADTSQGNGANVGEHQKATIFPNIFGGYSNIYAIVPNSDGMQTANADKSTYTSGRLQTRISGSNSSSSHMDQYTARPTNTSVLYCIKY